MRLFCAGCGKSVSSEISPETVIRAALICPECIERGLLDIDPRATEPQGPAADFDRIQKIGRRLKLIFTRDFVTGLDGFEDYIVRAVEEAETAGETPQKFKAEFLWGHEDGSIEEAGYEVINATTEEYRLSWWATLIERTGSQAAQPDRLIEAVRKLLPFIQEGDNDNETEYERAVSELVRAVKEISPP